MSLKRNEIILVFFFYMFVSYLAEAFSSGSFLLESGVISKSTRLATHTISVAEDSTTDDRIQRTLDVGSSDIHLISLPPVSDKSSKIIRDVWKWKDVVLGDGRDYFIPRPRALKALSDILVGSSVRIPFKSDKYVYTITECAILSNCARMDVLLVMQGMYGSNSNDSKSDFESKGELYPNSSIIHESAKLLVTKCILDQLKSFQNRRKLRGVASSVLLEGLSSVLDLPGMVHTDVDVKQKMSVDLKDIDYCSESLDRSNLHADSEELNFFQLLNSTNNVTEIVRHFSTVAAGIAPRASRPDRSIVFRPFSSRDAHIMLQLKRTAEVANAYPKVKVVLDCALTAGKAARDPKICTILEKLKPFAAEGKYSQKPPPLLEKEAIESVTKLAIEPAIEASVNRLTAMGASEQIIVLQKMIDEIFCKLDATNDSNHIRRKIAKKLMHQSVMRLRSGERLDLNAVVGEIEETLINT